MKKNNPGCDCCGGCDRCAFKCDGDLCPTICGFRIDVVQPDMIPQLTGEDCPPVEEYCPEEIACNACYRFFDVLFRFSFLLDDWLLQIVNPLGYADCNDVIYRFTLRNFADTNFPCWDASNYACPYELIGGFWQCGPNLAIRNAVIDIRSQWNPETNCGTITVTIEIEVREIQCLTSPLDPPKTATFTHLFELDYCTCEEMLQPIPFVSTTADNPDGLPEPCNLDEATITLIEANAGTNACPVCQCWECSTDNGLNLSVSGPGFTGTIPLTFYFEIITVGTDCTAKGEFNLECDGTKKAIVFLSIKCFDCETYKLFLNISIEENGEEITAEIDDYTCGADRDFVLSFSDSPICNLDEYTFSL